LAAITQSPSLRSTPRAPTPRSGHNGEIATHSKRVSSGRVGLKQGRQRVPSCTGQGHVEHHVGDLPIGHTPYRQLHHVTRGPPGQTPLEACAASRSPDPSRTPCPELVATPHLRHYLEVGLTDLGALVDGSTAFHCVSSLTSTFWPEGHGITVDAVAHRATSGEHRLQRARPPRPGRQHEPPSRQA
jgi:hypothetical protein